MRFVLDTDVLNSRRRARPHPDVEHWLASVNAADIAITVATVTEVQRGIERARPGHPDLALQLGHWLEGIIADASPAILPLTTQGAVMLGRMYETSMLRQFATNDPKAAKRENGTDLAVAAISIIEGAVIATGNIRHFQKIHEAFPLPGLFDPFSQTWHIGGP